ncbi:MAG: 2Fe-2S ferredoxin [Paenibacillaceae bacterium]|jgi:nitrite reductase/ring-hydroxylating ferredoxin subunit|nr:2Fe-2S ferredoxin [Paenibacillaceae bacterium]
MPINYVANAGDIPEGTNIIVDVKGLSIGVYNIGGEFFALLNRCPHEGAPLCKGKICGTTLPSGVYQYEYGRVGELVRCPWHGWEFEIRTGKAIFDEKVRAKSYKVQVDDGKVGIVVG